MKKLRNVFGFIAVLGMAAFLTGCGDDDNNDNNNGGGQQVPTSPQSAAAFANNTYNVNTGNGNAILRFANSGASYSVTLADGTVETGTIAGLHQEGNDWVGVVNPDNAQGTVRTGDLRVHFANNTGTSTAPNYSGTVRFNGANGAVEYPFNASANSGTTTGSTTGTTTGSTTGTTTGSTTGTTTGSTTGTTTGSTTGTTTGSTTGSTTGGDPNDLTGKTLQLNYNNGGGEKFVFTSATTAQYEGTENATYTYNATTHQFNATRTSTGSTYALPLNFNSGSTTAGTTTVTFTQPGEQPHNDPASFTLQ